MQSLLSKLSKNGVLAFAASLFVVGMAIAGCTSSVTSSISTSNLIPNTNTSTTPVTVTDAPSDQILAASLTLNSMILTDSTGKVTTNLLPATGITFEATHLDAVQEPLFSPAIPEDTYVSVTLTYSSAQVAYIDSTTHTVNLVMATLANTSQTITFTAPVTISNTTTSLLIDFLVANSVTISGSTVTVTPQFNIAAVPIPSTVMTTHKGKVTAISTSTNSFTLTDPNGTVQTIYVNASTVFADTNTSLACTGTACLSTFTSMKVNALVEVDTVITPSSGTTPPPGSLLATRVEVDDSGTTAPKLLLGPVTSRTPTATGTPATSFNILLRQLVGNSSAAAVETVDVSVTGSTNFLLPPRYALLASALPFTTSFTSSTIFAGQHVGVVTTSTGVTSGAATAATVILQPQTINGVITNIAPSGSYTVYTVALPAGHWLATMTGQTTVLVYTNSKVVPLTAITPAVNTTMRFNGYLFNVSNQLRLLACIQAGPPGTPII
ncbi:MAG: hypothetical protein ACLPXT_12685 [Terracidiphilus sp.]